MWSKGPSFLREWAIYPAGVFRRSRIATGLWADEVWRKPAGKGQPATKGRRRSPGLFEQPGGKADRRWPPVLRLEMGNRPIYRVGIAGMRFRQQRFMEFPKNFALTGYTPERRRPRELKKDVLNASERLVRITLTGVGLSAAGRAAHVGGQTNFLLLSTTRPMTATCRTSGPSKRRTA